MSNIYIAGSSAFPTAGATGPTFTLVALSLRLADHIAMQLRALDRIKDTPALFHAPKTAQAVLLSARRAR